MEKFEGYVERITFRNEENGYTVMTLKQGTKERCVTGIFPAVSEGEYLKTEGELTVHPVYGEQMKAESYSFVAPSDEASCERYLGSGAIKGVGPKMAARIVAKFGADTFRILEEEPERLSEIRGISERSAMAIAAQIIEKREMRNAMIFLQQYGISLQLAAKIYRLYGSELYRIIRENPYRLADDIQGVGFKSADSIAMQTGIRADSEFRVKSALLYVLRQSVSLGHTYYPSDLLLSDTEDLLGIEISDSEHLLTELMTDRRIIIKKDGSERRVYLAAFYRMESDTAILMREMNVPDLSESRETAERKIAGLEKEGGIILDPVQRQAVSEAVRNGITVITGGPGTGKTTTINFIIRYFLREGLDILLAAPTGRAAKRMTEATGFEATTIHRMLEVSGDPAQSGGAYFQRNQDQPLETDAVIIDEMSMVDITLMHALLKAMVPGMRLVLVGDADQLPSVGPGEVLQDIISSDCFPVVRLNRIFRQNEESDIIVNAHRINEGEMVEVKKSRDFLFILRDSPGQISGAAITLLREKLPNYVHCRPEEVQVLTPMRKGFLGVESLNPLLQEALNPKSPEKNEKEFSSGILREGDKVMQIKNDYQLEWEVEGSFPREHGLGVFNGDTGVIRRISLFEQTVTVEYEDRKIVTYGFDQTDEIELAYAVTIHKSQGSEYPAVILPLLSGPRLLMTRNLLYTGVTRARKCVCIVGKYDTFAKMIANDQKERRYTGLRDLFLESYDRI